MLLTSDTHGNSRVSFKLHLKTYRMIKELFEKTTIDCKLDFSCCPSSNGKSNWLQSLVNKGNQHTTANQRCCLANETQKKHITSSFLRVQQPISIFTMRSCCTSEGGHEETEKQNTHGQNWPRHRDNNKKNILLQEFKRTQHISSMIQHLFPTALYRA